MQPARVRQGLSTLAWALAAIYTLDRLLKLAATFHFLYRPSPLAPAAWPSVSLLQPITRGASDLRGALACRAALRYGGHLQHILICDAGDAETIALCQSWSSNHPGFDIQIVAVDPGATQATAIATKVEKLHAGLPCAKGAILAFVDDDILLRAEAIEQLVRHLAQPQAGSAFGLAVYTNWNNVPSSLLSAFVNANALFSYLPLTYLVKPFTITGHFYALRREVFEAIGGLDGMDRRLDDDHELARRVQRHGLANVQTPALYDVDNDLRSLHDYTNQMQRWFTIPRQTMVPFLTPRQQAVSLLGSLCNLIPPVLGLLALAGRAPVRPLLWSLALFTAVYAWCERQWLGRSTPRRRWPLVLISALIAPVQALLGLLGGDTFTWRGQRIRLHKGGRVEVIGSRAPAGTP